MSKQGVLRTAAAVGAVALIGTILEANGASTAAVFAAVLAASAAVAAIDIARSRSPNRPTPPDDKPKSRAAAGGSS